MAYGGAEQEFDSFESTRRLFSVSGRLESFRHWPKERICSAKSLAAAGFYYTGFSDNVKCAFCHGAIYNWDTGDVALVEHLKFFPHCSFAKDKVRTLRLKAIEVDTSRPSNQHLVRVVENWDIFRRDDIIKAVHGLDMKGKK